MTPLRNKLPAPALCCGCIVIASLAGCSDLGMQGKANDTAGAHDDTNWVDTSGSDSVPPSEPAWFTPRATIDVTGGLPSLVDLTLIVVDVDLETVICELPQDAGAATIGAAPDASVALWLSVPLTPTSDDCAELPSPIGLGIGELPADVRAQLGPAGLSDVATSLYGAMARAPDDASSIVSAFGYAGTPEDLVGDDIAALPPPDGQYVLNPLFLLQLPSGG